MRSTLLLGCDLLDDRINALVNPDLIRESLSQAKESVDKAINITRAQLYDGQTKSAAELLALFRFPGLFLNTYTMCSHGTNTNS